MSTRRRLGLALVVPFMGLVTACSSSKDAVDETPIVLLHTQCAGGIENLRVGSSDVYATCAPARGDLKNPSLLVHFDKLTPTGGGALTDSSTLPLVTNAAPFFGVAVGDGHAYWARPDGVTQTLADFDEATSTTSTLPGHVCGACGPNEAPLYSTPAFGNGGVYGPTIGCAKSFSDAIAYTDTTGAVTRVSEGAHLGTRGVSIVTVWAGPEAVYAQAVASNSSALFPDAYLITGSLDLSGSLTVVPLTGDAAGGFGGQVPVYAGGTSLGVRGHAGQEPGIVTIDMKTGKTTLLQAIGFDSLAIPLVSDGDVAYWTDSTTNGIYRYDPKSGAAPSLFLGNVHATSIAVDGSYVYWTEETAGSAPDGSPTQDVTVHRAPKG